MLVHRLVPPPGKKFAESMRYTEMFVQPLVDSVLHLECLRLIPDLLEITRYYIYTRSRDIRNCGTTVVLRTASCHFFLLQITGSKRYDGRPRLFLKVETYCGKIEDLVFRGRVWSTGYELIYSALNLLDRLGFYFKYTNNAQHFAEKFITTLGIGYYTCIQDFERVLLMSFGYSAAEIFKVLIARSPRPEPPSLDYYIQTEVRTRENSAFF